MKFKRRKRKTKVESSSWKTQIRCGVDYLKLSKEERGDKKHHKYELIKEQSYFTGIIGFNVAHKYFSLGLDGYLEVYPGYRWDGPSGPTFDTDNFMRGSLFHDVLYQMIREDDLTIYERAEADNVLYNICREDGMSWIRAKWVLAGVRIGGRWHV